MIQLIYTIVFGKIFYNIVIWEYMVFFQKTLSKIRILNECSEFSEALSSLSKLIKY